MRVACLPVTDVNCLVFKNTDVACLQETRDKKGDTLKLHGYRACHHTGDRTYAVSTYVKTSIPSELAETQCKTNGIESVCVKLHLQKSEMYIVSLSLSMRSFDLRYLPDCMYSNSALIVGDLNVSHPQLEERSNINDNGGKEATHQRWTAWLRAIPGAREVVSELLSDHFALYAKLV